MKNNKLMKKLFLGTLLSVSVMMGSTFVWAENTATDFTAGHNSRRRRQSGRVPGVQK